MKLVGGVVCKACRTK